jgi:resolvase-like protein
MKNVFAICLALTSLPFLSLRRLLLATILSFANILDSLVWPTCWFTLGLLMLALNGPTAHAGTQVPLTTPTVVTAAPVMQLSTGASDKGSSERSPIPESENDRLPINGRLPAAPRRKGPRSKAEIEQERRERIERTNREIDEIHAEYLAKFERGQGKATGAVYARFSTKFQDSIADQVRTILEFALAQGIYVPRNFVFYDMAIRGFKKNRAGLEQFEACLRRKKASVALFFSTSRLFRKQY